MQQAVDELYRRQPEAFAREPVAPPATEDDAAIDHAIGLHHLQAYGQLASERDLARLRDDAARSGKAIGAPLGEAMATRRAEILALAPEALRDAAGRRFDASAERLAPKAAAVDRLLADRRRADSLEQSIALGEALLREDPDRYEEILGESEGLTAALAPDPVRRDSLSAAIRKRYATAALEGELGPAGDPARAEADLVRGRFRDALEADEHAAWKEFAAFGRQRREAEAVNRARDGEVAAEAAMLARLDTAGRGEAPLPPAAAIEAAFPGEGEARQAAAKRDLKRQLYETQIALQPLDADEDWVLAGEEGEDELLRVRIAFNKRQAVERGDWEYLRRQVPTLAAAIEEAVEDPSKLGGAIALYQRHLAKLGVPPEKRWLLPDETLRRIASGYHQQSSVSDKRIWLEGFVSSIGNKSSARQILDALSRQPRFLPIGIAALVDDLGRPGEENTIENAIRRLDERQLESLSRLALRFDGDPVEATHLLGSAQLRSDRLSSLLHGRADTPEFRNFVAEAEEADVSPHGLDSFARRHGINPPHLRLLLAVSRVDGTTSPEEIEDLNRRILSQFPKNLDQGFLGMEVLRLQSGGVVDEDTRLRVIHRLLPFVTIRDPRDSEINEHVVDAGMGLSTGPGPFPPRLSAAPSKPRWAPESVVNRPIQSGGRVGADSEKPPQQATGPAANRPVESDRRVSADWENQLWPTKDDWRRNSYSELDPTAELVAKLRNLNGLNIENHRSEAVRRQYQVMQELKRIEDIELGRSAGRLVSHWRRLIIRFNNRMGLHNQLLVELILKAEGINFRKSGRRPTGDGRYYIPDFIPQDRNLRDAVLLDAKYSRAGRWKFTSNQVTGFAFDRRRGTPTATMGLQGNTFRSDVQDAD